MKRSADFAVSNTIDPRILDEAADWLMQLNASNATDEDRAACQRWRYKSPEHARAWARAELLMNKLGGLPASLAMPALDRPASANRRASIGKLAALLAVIPFSWSAWRLTDEGGWTADHHTATGEHRDVQLADGSRITINTASAIDVHFDSTQRLVLLRAGEILVQTARDTVGTPAAMHRPFCVGTLEGRMEALGTRFTVRQTEGQTHIAVLEGAVRIEPKHGDATTMRILHAGQKTTFTATTVALAESVDDTATAWAQGMLLADKMRLADFVAELVRYRQGFVRCDPAIADLRVSGAFPLAETDRALSMLVSTYPVAAQVRLRGLWVTLVPR